MAKRKMTEIKEFNEWLKEFEIKFGLTAYKEIINRMTSLLQANQEIRKSRDNWRRKYDEVKK